MESGDEDEDDQRNWLSVSVNVSDEMVTEIVENAQPLPTVSMKFHKTDSDLSLAASSDRETSEQHPFCGNSIEPADPPSAGYSNSANPSTVQFTQEKSKMHLPISEVETPVTFNEIEESDIQS